MSLYYPHFSFPVLILVYRLGLYFLGIFNLEVSQIKVHCKK